MRYEDAVLGLFASDPSRERDRDSLMTVLKINANTLDTTLRRLAKKVLLVKVAEGVYRLTPKGVATVAFKPEDQKDQELKERLMSYIRGNEAIMQQIRQVVTEADQASPMMDGYRGVRSVPLDLVALQQYKPLWLAPEEAEALPDLMELLAKDTPKLLGMMKAILTEIAGEAEDLQAPPVTLEAALFGLPRREIGQLGHEDIAAPIEVEGIVKKKTDVLPRLVMGMWECQHCGRTAMVPQTEPDVMRSPYTCEGCEKKGPFNLIHAESTWEHYQKIRVEPYDLGANSASIDVELHADRCVRDLNVGERVRVSGAYHAKPKPKKDRDRIFLPFIDAFRVQRLEDVATSPPTEAELAEIGRLSRDPGVYDTLAESIAPDVVGHRKEKEALVLQDFGCPPFQDGNRGDIHVLCVGDPGTAKSLLAMEAADRSPKARVVSGPGATAVGLTAAAVHDEKFIKGWSLEAGAMVLASGGLCVIDEADKAKEEGLLALHGPMEQQRVDINKAGINTTLSAKTSVLMTANPVGSFWDPFKHLAEQLNINPALISRFDLIFTFHDTTEDDEEFVRSVGKAKAPAVPAGLFKKYVSYARSTCTPEITPEADDALSKFFLAMRAKVADADRPQVTRRRYMSLKRLAVASARVRLSPRAELSDAKRAIELLQESLRQFATDPLTGQIDEGKSEWPRVDQEKRFKIIMKRITELCKAYDRATEAEILDETRQARISDALARSDLISLKNDGKIHSPEPGVYRLVH